MTEGKDEKHLTKDKSDENEMAMICHGLKEFVASDFSKAGPRVSIGGFTKLGNPSAGKGDVGTDYSHYCI